jgi:hypothetical protein
MMSDRIEDILDGIWYELMTMNAMKALELVQDPCLSSEERDFVAGVASAVIENETEGSDGGGDNPDEDDEK